MNFVIDGNISYNIVQLPSFHALLECARRSGKTPISMPSRRKFISTLATEFKKMKAELKETLQQQKHVCLTADAWSSRAQSYLGVTVHFLNSDFQRESYVLAFKQMFCKQTYKELAEAMANIFTDYNISKSQITNIVTDGGSNFAKMFKIYGKSIDAVVTTTTRESVSPDLDALENDADPQDDDDHAEAGPSETPTMSDINGEAFLNEILQFDNVDPNNHIDEYVRLEEGMEDFAHQANSTSESRGEAVDSYFGSDVNPNEESNIEMPPQRRCVSHLLNLTSSDFENIFLPENAKKVYTQTFSKLHTLWTLIHCSSLAKTTCKKVLNVILISPNDTRWNAFFDAVRMCNDSKIKPHLNRLIQQLKSDLQCASAKHLSILTHHDFVVIEQYVKVFEPVAISLDIMQKEKNASQGYIMPVLISMRHRVAQIDTSTTLARDFQTAMVKSIDKRFSQYFIFAECNKDLLLAAISFPRIKTSFIKEDDDIIFAKNLLIAECKYLVSDALVNDRENASLSNKSTENDGFLITYSSNEKNRRSSIDCEIDTEVSRFLCDMRTENSILNEYPNVKAVYFKYNTTLSSSAPIERVFSQSGLIFTPRRNKLSSENFERTVLLKHNRKLINDKICK